MPDIIAQHPETLGLYPHFFMDMIEPILDVFLMQKCFLAGLLRDMSQKNKYEAIQRSSGRKLIQVFQEGFLLRGIYGGEDQFRSSEEALHNYIRRAWISEQSRQKKQNLRSHGSGRVSTAQNASSYFCAKSVLPVENFVLDDSKILIRMLQKAGSLFKKL